MTDTGESRPHPPGAAPTGGPTVPVTAEPDRARVRRVGCLLGLFAFALFAAVFLWKLWLMQTAG